MIQVKSNQSNLYRACQIITNNYNPIDIDKQKDMGHGRIETRSAYVFSRRDYMARYIPIS